MSGLDRVALVGLPGAGKTTIGPLLASRLGWSAVDVDERVAHDDGRPPASIIDSDGEPAFRDRELAALERALSSDDRVVIACGGGLIGHEPSRRLLGERALVVWLDAPDDVLLGRLGGPSNRPLLGDDAGAGLARLRAERYMAHQTANVRVNADAPPDVITSRLEGVVEGAVRVAVPGSAYLVEVRPGAVDDVGLHLPPGATRAVVIADRAVVGATRRVAATLRSAGVETNVIEVTGGETLKTWATVGNLLTQLGGAALRRHDCVVAIGGGTVGDVAGFVAATHLRGVAWINIPTTLLAMVDSAVGGKTGVNLPHGKNLAGAIWHPRAVLADPRLLTTQPERSYRSAFAEIIKYSMIGATGLAGGIDRDLSRLLRRDERSLTAVIRHCVGLKAAIVSADDRDTGPRAVLNYGHTIGHALEAATGFGESLDHGEAVAVGMRVAGRLSIGQLGCPESDILWQDSMLTRCGLDPAFVVDQKRVLALLNADKKVVGDHVGWVLLAARGEPRSRQHVPERAVRAALEEVLAR